MLLIMKLAWRNVLRNKRRTFLSGIAIGIGLAALIFVDGMMIGMADNMVKVATETFLGQGQIHKEGFTQTYEVEKTIVNSDQILKKLEKESLLKGYAPRTASYAMLTSTANVNSVMLFGISPEMESHVSKIKEAVKKGEYLNDDTGNKILIGDKLAQDLEVDIGDRLVVTLAQANTGELSQEMFRVGGIFNFNTREMDRGMAFIPIKKAQNLLALTEGIHEIALSFKDIKSSNNTELPIWTKYSKDGNVAESWVKVLPELAAMFSMIDFSMILTTLILFGVVSLGIMNTLFMSLYERMFEFGVLRAIGTRPFRMGLIIVFEAASLAIISIVFGMIFGFIISYYFSIVGIDYIGTEFIGVTIQERMYVVMDVMQYIKYPILLFVFTVLVGIYPAVYAARLTPAKAMKKTF